MKKAMLCFYSIIVFSSILFPCDEECMKERMSDACEDGDFRACLRVGDIYLTGQGSKHNFILAQFLYEKAFDIVKEKCLQKSVEHCIALGVFHEVGKGTVQNTDEAAYIFHNLCNEGVCEGCNNLFRLKDELLLTYESQYFQCEEKYYTF
jgi:TPR repeat protein